MNIFISNSWLSTEAEPTLTVWGNKRKAQKCHSNIGSTELPAMMNIFNLLLNQVQSILWEINELAERRQDHALDQVSSESTFTQPKPWFMKCLICLKFSLEFTTWDI